MAKKKATRKTAKKSAAKTVRKTTAKRAPAKAKRASAPKKGPLQLTSVSPMCTVGDVNKSIAWYCDVLGCTVQDRWQHEGMLLGAELRAGDVTLMIGQDDWKLGRDRVKGAGVRLFCNTTQDIDRLAAAIKARGGTLAGEPSTDFGMRALSIEDPDGYKITIAKKLK